VAYRTKVLAVYIVGSVARGTSHRESDLDLAVIIPHKARKSALKVTEHYHARFTCNSQKPTWQGKQVDLQFFYADDKALAGYSKIAL
jgi:predicted nucleotidyltransferase